VLTHATSVALQHFWINATEWPRSQCALSTVPFHNRAGHAASADGQLIAINQFSCRWAVRAEARRTEALQGVKSPLKDDSIRMHI